MLDKLAVFLIVAEFAENHAYLLVYLAIREKADQVNSNQVWKSINPCWHCLMQHFPGRS